LSLSDLLTISRVCWTWCIISEDFSIWQNLYNNLVEELKFNNTNIYFVAGLTEYGNIISDTTWKQKFINIYRSHNWRYTCALQYTHIGHELNIATPSAITALLLQDKELITSSLDNKINLWNIGEFLEIAKKDSKVSSSIIDHTPITLNDKQVYLRGQYLGAGHVKSLATDDKVVVAGSHDGTITIFNKRSRNILHKFKDSKPVSSVILQDKYVSSIYASDNRCILWDLSMTQQVWNLKFDGAVVLCQDFIDSGKIAYGLENIPINPSKKEEKRRKKIISPKNINTLKIIDANTSNIIHEFPITVSIKCITHYENLLYACTLYEIKVYDLREPDKLLESIRITAFPIHSIQVDNYKTIFLTYEGIHVQPHYSHTYHRNTLINLATTFQFQNNLLVTGTQRGNILFSWYPSTIKFLPQHIIKPKLF